MLQESRKLSKAGCSGCSMDDSSVPESKSSCVCVVRRHSSTRVGTAARGPTGGREKTRRGRRRAADSSAALQQIPSSVSGRES